MQGTNRYARSGNNGAAAVSDLNFDSMSHERFFFSHSHLTSKNIFVNMSDMEVQIGDYGLECLKKYCKYFQYYDMLSNYSAPEIWEQSFPGYLKVSSQESEDSPLFVPNPKYAKKANFFNSPYCDIYSFGMILWELENEVKPFDNEKASDVFNLLNRDKLRPKIIDGTDKNLALLIRRCW